MEPPLQEALGYEQKSKSLAEVHPEDQKLKEAKDQVTSGLEGGARS